MDAGWGTGRGEVREHFEIRLHPTWLAFYFAHLEVEMFKGIAYPQKYDSYLLILMLFQCHDNFLCGQTERLCCHVLLH